MREKNASRGTPCLEKKGGKGERAGAGFSDHLGGERAVSEREIRYGSYYTTW